MTTANKITIFRILLVPFFIMQVLSYLKSGEEWHRWAAITTFFVAAVSDGVDGFIARHFGQRSELGAILDPLADKLLLVAGVMSLSFHNRVQLDQLPLWLIAAILSRDMIILLGMVLIHYVCGRVVVKAHLTGKVATVLQMAAVLWALFKLDSLWLIWICVAGTVFTAVSGAQYVFDGVRQLSAHPASGPSKDQTKR